MESEILPEIRKYFFRSLHPLIAIGTASDRYKGWLGQIYSEHLYAGRITSRKNTVGKNSFRQEILPVDSVREYFQHFRILEVDYTFYSPLIENGVPTRVAGTLSEYAAHLGTGDGVFVKVPQAFFARKLRRGKGHVPNELYLASGPFTRQFYEPVLGLLGRNLKGFIFEQEYQRSNERIPPDEFARALGAFFEAIPRDNRYHVELRTESYLSPELFDVLGRFGIGQILSHWTWLPSLAAQFRRSGRRFVHAGGQAVIRLMTPKDVRYEDAYARAFPFDAIREDLLQPSMLSQTAELMCEGINQGVEVNVIINNRSGGNAPDIGRRLVQLFIELGGKKEGTAR